MNKVAVVVFDDISVANGTTVRARRVAGILASNYETTVINCSSKKQKRLTGSENVRLINVRNVGMSLLVSLSIPTPLKLIPVILWNLKVAFVLLRNRFDVVYCANDWLGLPGIYLISKVKGNRVIFEAHAIYSEEGRQRGNSGIRLKLDQALEKFAAAHPDYVIALSQNTLEFYRKYTNRIDMVPVFVDTDLFSAKRKPESADRKLIGLIGPFDAASARQRGSLQFLVREIQNFDSRIDFAVIGRCDERIDDKRITYTGYLDSIKDYISRLHELDGVLIAEGAITYGPLNKIIEPMACSLPVFATPKGTVALYWVEPGRDIFVFDENEMVDKINDLVFDDSLMQDVGQNARKVVQKYYSKKAVEERLSRVIEALKK